MPEALIDGTGNAYTVKVNDQNKLMVSTTDEGATLKIAYAGTIPEYIGKSEPPANVGSATWQIKKCVNDGTNITDIKYASGTLGYKSFSFVWDSKADYTYI